MILDHCFFLPLIPYTAVDRYDDFETFEYIWRGFSFTFSPKDCVSSITTHIWNSE